MAFCKVTGYLCDGKEPPVLFSAATGIIMTRLPSGDIFQNKILADVVPERTICPGLEMEFMGEVNADFIDSNYDRICDHLRAHRERSIERFFPA